MKFLSHLMWIGWLSLLSPLSAQTETATAPAPLQLKLRERAEVLASTIQFRDMIEGNLDSSLGVLNFGTSPEHGKELSVRRSDIESFLIRKNIQWTWTGAEKCVVYRPGFEVSEESVKNLIQNALKKFTAEEGEVQIIKLNGFTPFFIPTDDATTNVELISPNQNTRFGNSSYEVNHHGKAFLRRNISFEWEWKRPVWVAQETQTSGLLKSESFQLENRNVLNLTSEAAPSTELSKDLILVRGVAKGEPILLNNLKIPLAVTRGSPITALVQSGSLVISMKAIALENGSVGQAIRIQNPQSKKELVGKVLRDGTVEVTL
jgi:flagella basal body P-ring formation protein FlgA